MSASHDRKSTDVDSDSTEQEAIETEDAEAMREAARQKAVLMLLAIEKIENIKTAKDLVTFLERADTTFDLSEEIIQQLGLPLHDPRIFQIITNINEYLALKKYLHVLPKYKPLDAPPDAILQNQYDILMDRFEFPKSEFPKEDENPQQALDVISNISAYLEKALKHPNQPSSSQANIEKFLLDVHENLKFSSKTYVLMLIYFEKAIEKIQARKPKFTIDPWNVYSYLLLSLHLANSHLDDTPWVLKDFYLQTRLASFFKPSDNHIITWNMFRNFQVIFLKAFGEIEFIEDPSRRRERGWNLSVDPQLFDDKLKLLSTPRNQAPSVPSQSVTTPLTTTRDISAALGSQSAQSSSASTIYSRPHDQVASAADMLNDKEKLISEKLNISQSDNSTTHTASNPDNTPSLKK